MRTRAAPVWWPVKASGIRELGKTMLTTDKGDGKGFARTIQKPCDPWDLRGKAPATEPNAPLWDLSLDLSLYSCYSHLAIVRMKSNLVNKLAHYDTWLVEARHSFVAIVSRTQKTPRAIQNTQGPCFWIRIEVYLGLCALEVSLRPFLEPDTSRDHFFNHATKFHIQTKRPRN
ncbi:hypothetical protein VNO77_34274 [Canavalia gladiata]|uniref:Uncharacterized protein n=1 Tax=Canavalia gladiata TaxID=3824 RepID=A0AAN9KF98_CANGL